MSRKEPNPPAAPPKRIVHDGGAGGSAVVQSKNSVHAVHKESITVNEFAHLNALEVLYALRMISDMCLTGEVMTKEEIIRLGDFLHIAAVRFAEVLTGAE